MDFMLCADKVALLWDHPPAPKVLNKSRAITLRAEHLQTAIRLLSLEKYRHCGNLCLCSVCCTQGKREFWGDTLGKLWSSGGSEAVGGRGGTGGGGGLQAEKPTFLSSSQHISRGLQCTCDKTLQAKQCHVHHLILTNNAPLWGTECDNVCNGEVHYAPSFHQKWVVSTGLHPVSHAAPPYSLTNLKSIFRSGHK